MPASVASHGGRDEGTCRARPGRVDCKQGHELFRQQADSGRCDECCRWIFYSESVLGCSRCRTMYCSSCCPQARTSKESDGIWDDFLAKLGNVLRDAESVKIQIANDVNVDIERLGSVFNCQNVGHETLSAEQIYVDHAIEQAKGILGACGAPESADLSSQEVIVGEDCEGDAARRLPAPSPTNAKEEELKDLPCTPREKQEVATEKQIIIAIDLLDLSEPLETEQTCGAQSKDASECMSDIDLLDLADPAPTNEALSSSLEALAHVTPIVKHRGTDPDPEKISGILVCSKAQKGASKPDEHIDLLGFAPLPSVNAPSLADIGAH